MNRGNSIEFIVNVIYVSTVRYFPNESAALWNRFLPIRPGHIISVG